MAHKPRLLTREALTPALVTDADRFTVGRYLRQREDAPAIAELEVSGERKLPGAQAALADTFNALWSDTLGFRPEAEIAPARRYWRTLLGETATTPAFEELHARTEGDMLLSFIGTIEAGETLLKFVPAEDAEQLRDIAEAQAEANAAEEAAANAQAEADAFAEMADVMSGGSSGAPMPGNGQGTPGGMTAAQAQAAADRLTQQWEEAQAQADAARASADAAKAAANAKADALLGQPGSDEAKAKADDLRRLGLAAAKAAGQKVEEFSDTVQAWGVEPAEFNRVPFEDAVNLVERLRRSEALKSFAALLGRLKAMAARKAKSRAETGAQKVPRSETGRDLARLHPREFARLAHPAMRVGFYTDWAHGALQLRGTEEKRTQGHGPVVVCEDASGSMNGARQQWAKGIVLSLAHFAKLRRRDFGWVMFDARVHRAETYPKGQVGATAMLDIAEARAGGGTDFERPLRRAVEMIAKDGLKKADIAFITDGDCAVSTEFLKWFSAEKRRLEFSVLAVICDDGYVSDATVKQFADRVERASAFTAEEADAKVFRHL